MKHEIIEIDKTSELFPRSLIEIGDDCPEKLYLMGNVELLKAEKAVAIVGSGLDIVHPRENILLQKRILQRQGLVLSEQPLGTKASPKTLVRRNRLQAALSQIVVVAQCPAKSGTLYTVEFARQYGKEVRAAQFNYHNEFTGGNDKLLAEGIATVI